MARILPIGTTYNPATTTLQLVPTSNNPYRKSDGTYYGAPFPPVPTFNTVYFAQGVPVPLMTLPPSTWKGCVMARYTPHSTENDGDVYLNTGSINGKQWMAWQPAPSTYQCPSQGTRRLTNVKAQVKTAIDQVINPSNNTNLAVGLVWGWRLLGDGPQEALKKSIASGPSSPYYQYAPDAPALQMVFKEIGNHLLKLRVSK